MQSVSARFTPAELEAMDFVCAKYSCQSRSHVIRKAVEMLVATCKLPPELVIALTDTPARRKSRYHHTAVKKRLKSKMQPEGRQ